MAQEELLSETVPKEPILGSLSAAEQ
jgi:hypothetical protein